MNRRTVLKSAATLAAASGLTPHSKAATPDKTQQFNAFAGAKRNRMTIASTLAPWTPSASQPWDVHTIGHLYRRAGFGATMAEINILKALTPGQVIDTLLDNTLMGDGKMPPLPRESDRWYNKVPYLGTDYTRLVQQQTEYSYANMEIRRQWGVVMSEPGSMLREKMALFWMNHFVVESSKVYYPQLMYRYLDYFRHNAWGDFKQMTKDVTIQGAMLYYLDGYLNQAYPNYVPNENYARELLELFTLGVTDKDGNPNYTEFDIREIAKALTGYTVDRGSPEPNVLATKYTIGFHDATFKQVFGTPKKQWGLASAGVEDDIIDHIFTQRGDQLAWFICSKLYQYFVYNDISGPVERGIIDQMAVTFKSSNWSIKAVLSELFKSEHFFDEANIGDAIKAPYEHVIGMIRQFDLPLNALQSGSLYYYTFAGGQQLLDPPNVKGWPGYRSWISTTTLPLRNGIGSLLVVTKALPAYGADGYGSNHQAVQFGDAELTTWAKQFPGYTGQFEDYLAEICMYLFAQSPSAFVRENIIKAIMPNAYEWPPMNDTAKGAKTRELLNALLSLADYQLA